MSRSRSTRRGARPRQLPLLVAAALLAGGALFARPSSDGASGSGTSGDGAGVEAALQRAVETPGDAGRENDLGNQLLLAGDDEGAEAAYRRAIAAAPDDVTPRYNLGRLLLERGHRFSARRELAHAVELDPGHAEARYFLGVAYDDLGWDWLARRHYRRAFELEPALADPRRHPEFAHQRQALAALIETWIGEEEPSAETIATATDAARSAPPADAGDAAPSPPQTATEPAAVPNGTAGGYARVTGGERTDRSQGTIEPEPNGAGEGTAGWQAPRKTTRSRETAVIDPSDLRSGTSVNQVIAPGESARGGRGTTSRPTKPSSRGFGSRFTPPERPIDDAFEPDEESTGRIEPLLLAPDDEQF